MIRYLIFLVFISMSCSQQTEKILEYDRSCDDIEVSSDIKWSIDKIEEFMKEKNITIREVSNGKCGYTLTYKSKTKEIDTALMDVDLLTEIETFYTQKI